MDLVKIGAYIAGKRKALGLTQRELAEKLRMSDKSVSKWERGICLPDVSVYLELCGILGISLNEFLAGEDLDEGSLPRRSEENLLSVSRDGKSRRRRLKRIIAVLAAAALLLGGVLSWVLTADARLEKNRIFPFPGDSTERKTAELLSRGDGAFLFRYDTDGGFRTMTVYHAVYRRGELTSREALFSAETDRELVKSGVLGMIPDDRGETVEFFVAGNGAKYRTELPASVDAETTEYLTRTASERVGVFGIEEDREYVLLVLGWNTLRSCRPEDLEAGGAPPQDGTVHSFSVVFSK